MENNVVCVGNLTEDNLLYVESFPSIDDVGYVNENVNCLGGRGALVSIILGNLGIKNSLCTVIPKNRKSDTETFLNANNVSTDLLSFDEYAKLAHRVFIIISKTENNCVSYFCPGDVNFAVSPLILDNTMRRKIFYFSTHKIKFNKEILSGCNFKENVIVHNLSEYFLKDRDYVNLIFEKSTHLVCNNQEWLVFKKALNITESSNALNRYPNLKAIFITKGVEGSICYTPENEFKQDIIQCDGRSYVGAGDAYSAGIVYSLIKGYDIKKTLELSAKIASISIESKYSYPDFSRLKPLLCEYI